VNALLTLALVWTAAAATPPVSTTTAMFRGGPEHSGVQAAAAPREFHRVRWTFPTGARIVSSPVLLDGVIYFGSNDNNVYAVAADSGRQLWAHATGGTVAATPAVAGGFVYAGSYDGRFYALDAKTGATRWKFRTGGERRYEARGLHGFQPRTQTIADPYDLYLSSPVVANGTVYFGSGDGNVYALDAASGALRWKFATGDIVHASPAFADGVVYVGSWDSWFYAIDAATGKERWRFHGGEDALMHNQVGFQSSPAVVDGVVYTGCRDANLYALDAKTGAEKWKLYHDGSWVISSPAVAGGKIYYATSDSALFDIVDAATGKPDVQEHGNSFMFSSAAIAGDVVVMGVSNGSLEARDRASGKLLWEFQTAAAKQNLGWVLTAQHKLNNSLLFRVLWQDNVTVAVERLFAVGAIFSSPLVANGVVYFGSTDGNLYAIE